MKKHRLLSCVIAVTMMSAVSAIPSSAETAEQDGLSVSYTTDKDSYEATDTINATLKVTNNNSGSVYDVQLDETVPEGYAIAEGSQGATTVDELKSGESVELKTAFVHKDPDENNSSSNGSSGNNDNNNSSVNDTSSTNETSNNGENASSANNNSKPDNEATNNGNNSSNNTSNNTSKNIIAPQPTPTPNPTPGPDTLSSVAPTPAPAPDPSPTPTPDSSVVDSVPEPDTNSVVEKEMKGKPGGGDNAWAYAVAAIAMSLTVITVGRKGKTEKKKMLSIAISGAMLTSLLPRLDIDANAVSKNIEISTATIVNGKSITLNATVTYSVSEPNPVTEPEKHYDENNVGEIYFSPTAEEHVAFSEEDMSLYADNEILIVAKQGVSKVQIEKIADMINAEIVGYIEQTGDYQLRLNSGDPISIIENLKHNELILEVSLNYITYIEENTINWGNEYIHSVNHTWYNTDANETMWGYETINVPTAWKKLDDLSIVNAITEDNYVNVGLIDNTFYRHEDLGFADILYETEPSGESPSHGTHVSGTFAARGDNVEGICGVYPYGNQRLYAVSNNGISNHKENVTDQLSSIANKVGLAELIFRNVKVINYSMNIAWDTKVELRDGSKELYYKLFTNKYSDTSLDYNCSYNDFTNWLIETLNEEGSLKSTLDLGSFMNRTLNMGYDYVVVVAAGNESVNAKTCTHYALIDESDYKNVFDRIIIVGSINKDLNISYFSNRGERVDIYAPGQNIFSTVGSHSYSSVHGLDSWNGTSMASPHVAGVAANIWTVNNNLSGAQVKSIIKESVLTGSKDGYPIIDAAKAIDKSLLTTGKENPNFERGAAMGWVFDNTDGSTEYNAETWEGIENCGIIVYRHGEKDPIEINGNNKIIMTDSKGHYELMLPAGIYDIKAIHDDYGEQTIENVEVFSNQVTYCAWIVFNDAISSTIAKIPGKEPIHTYNSNAEWAWTSYDHPNYDTSSGYDKHIIIDGNNIKMDGYLRSGYNDFLFVNDKNPSKKVLSFDIHRDTTSSKDSENNWHSMLGGGFLFNTTISDDESTISGYYVLITESGLSLYTLDNVNLEEFRNNYNGSDGNKNGGKHTLLQKFTFNERFAEHHIRIEANTTSFSLYDGDNIVIDNYELPATYGSGFGPITSHLNHDCEQRSFFTFSNITMQTM